MTTPGGGVLAVFKYAGSDLLGIDFGGSSSGQTKETVIQKVDLSKVEAELSSISKQLEKNSAASISWNGPSRTASPASRSRWRI